MHDFTDLSAGWQAEPINEQVPRQREKRRKNQQPDRDPLADYREWVENRYNPGRWLGANTPPDVRNLWSTKDRRWLGLGFAIMGAAFTIPSFRIPSPQRWMVAIHGLSWLILGIILLFSRDYPKGKGE